MAKNTYSTDLEDSSSQYWSIADGSQSGLDITGNMSISLWAKFEALPVSNASMTFVSKYGYENNTRQYGFSVRNHAGTYRLQFVNSTNGISFTEGTVNIPSNNLRAGVWYHFGIAKTTTTATFYMNGKSIGTATVASSQANSTATFAVGIFLGGSGGTDAPFDGKISEVLIYSADIGATAMLQNATSPYNPYTTNAVSRWKFDNNGNDSIGSNNLTNNNTATFATDTINEFPLIFIEAAGASSDAGVNTLSTASITVSGSDTIGYAYAMSAEDDITGVNWNGVAMTLVDKQTGTDNVSLYQIYGPTTGVVTANRSGTSGRIQVAGAYYVNAKQTGQPEVSAKNSNTGATSISQSMTTTTDNAWGVFVGYGNGGNWAASTNSTSRIVVGSAGGLFDSNGPISPAGAFSMAASTNNGDNEIVMAGFIPVAAAAGPANVKTFDGVTQSTGIKTYFGTAIANVKTVDGAT